MTARALAAGCAPPLLIALDFAFAGVAAPGVGAELELDAAGVAWLFSAFSLAFGCWLMLGGRLADRLGPVAMLRAGLLAFAAGALATAAAGGAPALIAGRALQGLGAACMMPAALALLAGARPPGREREAALGLYGGAVAAGFVAGALIAGALTGGAGWRAVMAVECPLASLGLGLAGRLPGRRGTGPPAVGLDLGGALLAGAAVLAVILACGQAPGAAGAAQRLALLGVGAALLAALVVHERSTPDPLLGRSVTERPQVVVACAAGCVLTGTAVGATLLLTTYLQQARGFSPLEAGAAFALFGAVAPAGVALARSRPARACGPALGLALQGAALLLLGTVAASGGVELIALGIAGFGLGHVAGTVAVTVAALSRAPNRLHGTIGAALIAAQRLGGAVGAPLLGAVAAAGGGAGFRTGMAAGGGLALVGTAALLLLARAPQRRSDPCPVPSTSRPAGP
jgi:MFS family permease